MLKLQEFVLFQIEHNSKLIREIFNMLMEECNAKLEEKGNEGRKVQYLREQLIRIEEMSKSDDTEDLISKFGTDLKFQGILKSLKQALSFTDYIEIVVGGKEISQKFKEAKQENCKLLEELIRKEQ